MLKVGDVVMPTHGLGIGSVGQKRRNFIKIDFAYSLKEAKRRQWQVSRRPDFSLVHGNQPGWSARVSWRRRFSDWKAPGPVTEWVDSRKVCPHLSLQ